MAAALTVLTQGEKETRLPLSNTLGVTDNLKLALSSKRWQIPGLEFSTILPIV